MTSAAIELDPGRIMDVKLEERKGRLHVILDTDVTSTQVSTLRKGMMDALNEYGFDNWKFLYLDMRDSRMVDSMGVNWLFAENVRLKENGKQLVIRISSPAINRVLQFAGLEKLVTIKFRRRKQTR